MATTQKKLNKKILVNTFGGKCQICGYEKCMRALSFHHKDPKKKKLEISKFARNSKLTYAQIVELEKCVLLCANCHAEVHTGMHKEIIDEIDEIDLIGEFFD